MNAITPISVVRNQKIISSIRSVETGLGNQLSAVKEYQAVLAQLREELAKVEVTFANYGKSFGS